MTLLIWTLKLIIFIEPHKISIYCSSTDMDSKSSDRVSVKAFNITTISHTRKIRLPINTQAGDEDINFLYEHTQ